MAVGLGAAVLGVAVLLSDGRKHSEPSVFRADVPEGQETGAAGEDLHGSLHVGNSQRNGTDDPAESDRGDAESGYPVMVFVSGAVRSPGVYGFSGNARVYEAVERAGGFSDDADRTQVNLAETVFDGEMVKVPFIGESIDAGTTVSDGKVNLNTATKAELMALSGIGEAKAEAIIAYRTEHGRFQTTADIMKVSGIGEGLYSRIKDSIKV